MDDLDKGKRNIVNNHFEKKQPETAGKPDTGGIKRAIHRVLSAVGIWAMAGKTRLPAALKN